MTERYPFASGNLLETPPVYDYSAFGGVAFLKGWLASRAHTLRMCQEQQTTAKRGTSEFNPQSPTGRQLAQMAAAQAEGPLTAQDREAFDRILRNFEAKKQLFRDYNPGYTSKGRTDRGGIALFVLFSKVAAGQYRLTHRLPYLNALLKALDMICAHLADVPESLHPELQALLTDERRFVLKLAESIHLPDEIWT